MAVNTQNMIDELEPVNTPHFIDELGILLAFNINIPADHLKFIRKQIANPTLDEQLMVAYIKNLSSNEKTKFIKEILVDATEQQKWTQLSKTDAELQKETEEAAYIQAEELAEQQAEQQRILAEQLAAQQLAEQLAAQQLAEQLAAQQLAEQQAEQQRILAEQLAAQQAELQAAEQQRILAAQQLAAQQQEQQRVLLLQQQQEQQRQMIEQKRKNAISAAKAAGIH